MRSRLLRSPEEPRPEERKNPEQRKPARPDEPVVLPGWLLIPGGTILAVSLLAFFGLARVVGLGGYDLSVYLLGGAAFRHGQPVYDQIMRSRFGSGYFTYPPVTLLLFGPLSRLPHPMAQAIALVAGIFALIGTIWLTLRMIGAQPGPGLAGAALGSAGAALWLQPVFDSLIQGQVNLVIMLMVVTDVALEGRRRWPTGILIGAAAAMKITPVFFIAYLLLTRRYRAALTASVTAVALTAVGFVAARPDSMRFWFGGTFSDAKRVASPLTVGTVFNQSIHGVAVRLLGEVPGDLVWLPVALVVAAGGLAVAVTANRLESPLAGLLACALTGLLVSPLTWHEHWVWIVPVLIWLAAVARRLSRTPISASALPCLAGLPFLMWPQPTGLPGQVGPASILSPARHLWEDEGNHHPLVALAGTAYVAVGLLLLTTGGWALRRLHVKGISHLGNDRRPGIP